MAAACVQKMAKELSLQAFIGILPTVSTKGCSQAMTMKALQPLMELPQETYISGGSEDGAEPGCKDLTRARAVALQHELLLMYRSAPFQKKLTKLPQDEEEHFHAFRKLVRGVQMEVLPKYGFEATDQGLKELHACFTQFADDAVVSAMSTSIVKMLSTGLHKKQGEELSRRREEAPEVSAHMGALTGLGPLPTKQMLRMTKLASTLRGQQYGQAVHADALNRALLEGAAQAWNPSEMLSKEASESEGSEQEGVPLTKARAEYALGELEGAFSARRFQKKVEVLDDGKQRPLELRYTKKGILDAPLATGVKELAQPIFTAILPSYGFPPCEKGVGQFWQAIRPLAEGDNAMMKKANAVLRKLQSSRREVLQDSADLTAERPRSLASEADEEAARLPLHRALDLQSELLQQYSSPRFQTQLNAIHRTYSPSSKAFGHSLQKLLLEVYEEVLPRFGFATDEDGLLDFTMEMGLHWGNPEVQVLAGAIDDTLYGSEQAKTSDAGSESRTRRLRRPKVLRLMREQVEAFGRPAFQKRVQALREAMCSGREKEDFLHLSGRKDLAMIVQKKLLPKYGLPPTDFGVHSMFLQCAHYIMDPEVARLTIAINRLLGMERSAAKTYVSKLQVLQEDVAVPTR